MALEAAALIFVGKAVATAVTSNRVNWVISKIETFLKSEGLETTKTNLDKNLPHIQAVLLAVDRDLIKEQNAKLDEWLWQLRDAVQEAEDAVDELDYYKQEEKVKAQYNGVHVGCTVPTLATISIKKQIKKLAKHIPKPDDATLKRLKNAVDGLNKVAERVSDFLQLINGINKTYNDNKNREQQQTGYMLTGEVFGRDKERDTILQWVYSRGDSETDYNVSAFSIVGMGGIGKTTLARLIYNEVETKRLRLGFSEVIWVSISDVFETLDKTVVMRMIFEGFAKNSRNNFESMSVLQNSLTRHVARKKFFLVLDDIWRHDPDTENQLRDIIAPLLKDGKKGSKILFTTRMESVVDMIAKVMEGPGRKKNRLVLGGLEEREFVKLFNKNVFGNEDPNENKNFQRVVKQIARKVGGSPLGAKVMGRLLNNHKGIQHWDQIVEQDISQIQIGENGIIAALKMNYHHLDGNVQQCLRFCSLFPHNFRFKKYELVQMWIGSGLILSESIERRLEDIGADTFDILIEKSFFQLSEGPENCYVMNDLMHEMTVMVSSGECMRTNDVYKRIPKTIRHLSIKIQSLTAIKEISHVQHLQTLFIEFNGEKPEKGELKKFEGALRKLKSLRLLSLIGDNLFELPKSVGNLKHLRYISLHQTGEKELDWFPSSVYKLYHLQVMIFTANNVRDLTKAKMGGVNNLIDLRSLNVHSSVMRKIPHINALTSIRKITMFNITNGRKISELKDLKELHELEIHGLENVKYPQEAKEAKLNEKKNLRVLSLNWYQTECVNHNEILENLKPYHHLQKLQISGFNSDNFPVWMTDFSFRNFTSLEVKDCGKLKSLPPFGNLPSLKFLVLSNFAQLTKIDGSFYGRRHFFPSLKELRIQDMDKLEKWIEIEIQGRQIFPRLEILGLEGCPLLTKLPKLPLTLQQLDVKNSGLNMIPTGLESLKRLSLNGCPTLLSNQNWENSFPSSIEELKIEGCGDNISLESSLRNLGSLTRLDLINCPDIKSFPPAESFVKLVSLSKLHISNCKVLSSLGGLKALLSLKYLKLTGCEKLVTISQSETPKEIHLEEMNLGKPTLNLDELHLDPCSLLFIEPIKSHCCTRKLNISSQFEERFLPTEWLAQNVTFLKDVEIDDASALKTVPPSLAELKCIEKLKLNRATRIDSLAGLPGSLIDLVVTSCGETVKENYKEGGSHWCEIDYIPFVVIS